MEQEIILEGIHAMLEEIRDNLKKNPEVETIKLKLGTIEKVYNEFAGQKFVTEDVLAQFLAYTLGKVAEMNKKQEEKIRGYISLYHKFMKERFTKQQEELNAGQKRIENLLIEVGENRGLLERCKQLIRQFRI